MRSLIKSTTIAVLILSSVQAFPQQIDRSNLIPVYPFNTDIPSHCSEVFDTTYPVASLPVQVRSKAISKVYSIKEFVPFKIYWTPFGQDKSYFLKKGSCRGFSVSVPVQEAGNYTIIFEHPLRPTFMQISVTPLDLHQAGHYISIRYFAECSVPLLKTFSADLNKEKCSFFMLNNWQGFYPDRFQISISPALGTYTVTPLSNQFQGITRLAVFESLNCGDLPLCAYDIAPPAVSGTHPLPEGFTGCAAVASPLFIYICWLENIDIDK